MVVEQKQVLSLTKSFIMDATFSNNSSAQKDSIFRNVLSSKQITPLPVSIKIDDAGLVFSSRNFGTSEIMMRYDAIEKVELTVYSRLVPTKGAAMNFPTCIYPVHIKLKTYKGFHLEFESIDYNSLKHLMLKLKLFHIPIMHKADLVKLLLKNTPNEILEYFQNNWSDLVDTYSFVSLKKGYSRL